LKSGLTFLNSSDVDNTTKSVMGHSCSSLACFGLNIILNLLESENKDSSKYQDLISWTGRLLDVILAEFFGCMGEMQKAIEKKELSNSLSEKCVTCLFVLRKAVSSPTNLLPLEEIRNVLSCSFKFITFTDVTSDMNQSITDQACAFVEAVCNSSNKEDVGKDLLIGVLKPLVAFEGMNPTLVLKEESNVSIMKSTLRSIQLVLKNTDGNENIIKSLIQFAMKVLENTNESIQDTSLKATFHDLILFCMSGNSISDEEKHGYITKMAENGCWDAWQQCVDSKDPLSIQSSLQYVQDALSDHSNQIRHTDALFAMSNILKCNTELVAPILVCIGPMVLELFHLYGTYHLQGTKRTAACATCMKIIMLTFSYKTSENEENIHTAAFLSMVFQILVDLISYNGLPNDKKVNPGSDQALGRMSAQFFVHVLRTSPTLFKECMGSLPNNVRLVLESSVRAEMSGYASVAPVKKKLNLKSFKK
jgi:hypothetical protein